MNLTDLKPFEIPGLATFANGPGGLPQLRVTTPLASASIYLHGAHVAEFQPSGAAPVLFTSAVSVYAAGKPIRGGVPVIFPWFGGRAGYPDSPAHGFARTLPWVLESLTRMDGPTVEVVLKLSSSDSTRALWANDFILRHRIVIGSTLAMTLEVENPSGVGFEFEEALHTYFQVSDVREVTVTGLGGASYLDKMDASTLKTEGPAPIAIMGETDRVYLDTTATCEVRDPGLSRRIVIAKSGSASTVVWNPWIAKSKAMADFGDEEWPGMICIESANAAGNFITLAPGAIHRMGVEISLAPI